MTDWQITAKTIFCDAVDDEITILVYKDGSVKCTGFAKYSKPNEQTRHMVNEKKSKLKRPVECEGEGCPRVTAYKQSVLQESSG